jgi:hypothetical protein
MRIAQMFLSVTPPEARKTFPIFGPEQGKSLDFCQDVGAEKVDWVKETPALAGKGEGQRDRRIDKQGEVTYCLAG